MTGLLIGLGVTAIVVWLIIKNYQPHTVLLLAGLFLLATTAVLMPDASILHGKGSSIGWVGLDVFGYVKWSLSSTTAELGMIIMAAGGFSKYMDKIGATDAMVAVCIRPLKLLKAPYVVLALGCAAGQVFHIFIPSAAGQAMLLVVTFFPTLVRLGVSPAAAAAMIGTTAVLDLGPASGGTNLAAEIAGLDVTVYFTDYQIPAAAIATVVISVLTYVTARYYDRRAGHAVMLDRAEGATAIKCPAIYALLPMAPLTLILGFTMLAPQKIHLDVVTAMLISAFSALGCEMIRGQDAKAALKRFMAFFEGMGTMFTQVVSLIICAETFANGLQTIGAVGFLTGAAQGSGFGVVAMTLVMCAIVILTAIVTGSGNAAFFAFGKLAPKIAGNYGVPAVSMLLQMQLCASLGRSLSPVAAIIIAVSEVGQCSPMEIVRRTAIPVVGGLLAVLLYGAANI
ncbi:MAG TPA: C4-dicarboxylate transporter DcuC [Telmatospirillum sp.]|nr:C4-dicarboxylate transporter DcuC [Telmatospirillum sp.]